jgi:Mrp family chromosome partitioning ATPase
MWRYRWAVLVVVLAFGGAGYGLSVQQPQTYTASAQMVLADPRTSNVFSEGFLSTGDLVRRTSKQAEYVTSTRVLGRAAEELGGGWTTARLRSSVAATADPELDLVQVTASAGDPEQAALVANAVTEAYRATVRDDNQDRAARSAAALADTRASLEEAVVAAERQLVTDPDNPAALAERDAASEQLAALQARGSELAVNAALYGDGLEFAEPAIAPFAPTSPRPIRNGVAAGLLGFLLAAPLCWVRADRHHSVDHASDPAPLLEAPLLGEIPEAHSAAERAALQDPAAMPSGAYDFVAVNLEHAVPLGIILVTSPCQGDGKTVSALNLAAALVRDDLRVALVDGDARLQGLTRLLGVDTEHPGLTDLARGATDTAACRLGVRCSENRLLNFIPSGPAAADISRLYRSSGMLATLQALREEFDVVLIDSPPILAVSDTASLTDNAAGVVVIVRRGTATSLLERTRQNLAMVRTPIIGYVFTRSARWSSKDSYSRMYDYELPAAPPEPRAQRARPTPGSDDATAGQQRTDRQRQRNRAPIEPTSPRSRA